ncbi:50S ribosomal protein L24 [Candidatus Peregrinibacteria bacterium]|nr:MAG: 50S ribosomal protein L24 [Candidatus Peregrinibacteria bacterium]
MKIKVNDNVVVIAGKYKGKTGKVMRVYKKTNRVVVEKVNIRTRHIKSTPQQAGQRIQYEAPMDASKVMVICPKTKKATRIGYVIENGKKYRVCKVSGERLDDLTPKTSSKKKNGGV